MELAKIEGEEIVIRVPLSTLESASQIVWDQRGYGDYKVSDLPTYAKAFVAALNNESENGTTLVHRALDGAACYALDQGCEGVEP